jgi:hypothetical protein
MQDFFRNDYGIFSLVSILILIAIFLPYRQADLTASALLQGTCGEEPQLRTLCLASAATSTGESSRRKKFG